MGGISSQGKILWAHFEITWESLWVTLGAFQGPEDTLSNPTYLRALFLRVKPAVPVGSTLRLHFAGVVSRECSPYARIARGPKFASFVSRE